MFIGYLLDHKFIKYCDTTYCFDVLEFYFFQFQKTAFTLILHFNLFAICLFYLFNFFEIDINI